MNALKVLLADDHDNFRRILLTFLKSQKGVEVIGEAADGLEVVEKTAALHPDLVFMDIHMPKQNGLEATKIIKDRWPATRVFILSMDAGEFYKQSSEECADGFIAKSSLKNDLLSVISHEQQLLANTLAATVAA